MAAPRIQLLDFNVDLLRAILWQFNDAANLQGLLEAKNAWYVTNQTNFWENWIRDVFDLRTANQFGLVVWSIILGLPLFSSQPPYPDKPTFGFEGSGDLAFDQSNFTDQNHSGFDLPLATQRRAMQLRAYQIISSGTVPEINRALKFIFGGLGESFIIDYHNMTQAIVFMFPVTADLQYIFNTFDLLPRPAGVQSHYIDGSLKYFGFNSFNYNFDNGNFAP